MSEFWLHPDEDPDELVKKRWARQQAGEAPPLTVEQQQAIEELLRKDDEGGGR